MLRDYVKESLFISINDLQDESKDMQFVGQFSSEYFLIRRA